MSAVGLPNTMRAAVWTGPDAIEVRDVALPEVPEGWVLLRSELTGLCGTDFSILHGTHPRAEAPLIMGHEITGVIEVTTEGAPPVGTRATVEPLISCGTCHACSAGFTHVCRNLQLYGIDVPGSLAEFVAVPAATLLPFSESVSAIQAALAEPLAVAVHAVSQSQLAGGERVVVYGAGPIGMLTALVARDAGASEIWISEPSEARRAVAERLGFSTIAAGEESIADILKLTDGAGADIVFDSAAHPSVAAVVPRAVRIRGTVVLVGVYKKPVEVDLQALTFAENVVVGVRVYTRADMQKAVELIEQDALGLDRIPVSVFDLADTTAAFEKAMAATDSLKVLVTADPSLVTEGPHA